VTQCSGDIPGENRKHPQDVPRTPIPTDPMPEKGGILPEADGHACGCTGWLIAYVFRTV
jgi:hypothetical protein